MPDHFRRALVVSAAIIAASLVVFASGFYLFSLDLKTQSDKILAERTILVKKTAEIGTLADLKKNSAQADVYKQAMDKILVSQDQLLDFPRWLDGLARGRQVAFDFSFTGQQVPPQEKYPGYINFNLGSSGSLGGLLAFLKDVESQAPRFLVSLDNIDFSGGNSSYRFSSQGRVFFR